MTYIIAEPCIGIKDKSCIAVCPMDCIHGNASDPQLYINPAECIDCGACAVECPVDAIFYEADLPQEWRHYARINAEYYR